MRGAFGLRHFLFLGAIGTALLFTAACGDDVSIDNQLVPGQTDFTNTEPGSSGYRGGGLEGGDFSTGASKDSSGQNAAPPTAPGKPPSGREGQVEEADIYKVDNNRLFYLNTYRGFLVYDLKEPKHPKLMSRLPVYGYPIEMFVQKNTVYALIKDALYLTQVKGKLQFKRRNVSQLVAIDISDLTKPKILKTVDIVGQLREGVSRKIQDTIYVVSYISRTYYSGWYYSYNKNNQKDTAWVYSFNVADPKNLKLVDKLQIFEGGGYSSKNSKSGTYASRYFSSVTISATSNALMVVENWRKYGYISGSKYNCGNSYSLQQAMVSIVDISDPYGKIKLHTKFETYGALGDQFKQTYFYDKKTGKGTYIGIFARREWESSNCSGKSIIQNTMESWDVTMGKYPKRQHEIAFGKPNETVRGSVFDRDRKVAFAITARQMDPLYAISFANPTKLKILSEVDGLAGDMNVFRFINDKKFLIAIGRDNSGHCTGYGTPATGWSTKVAVSVIDVQDLSKIKLVQRKCVAVKNASWVSSAVNTNLDQAHKMIGMHSDSKANVITVPVYYRKKTTSGAWWWYGYETAVGMMTWDLGKYDPTKSHKEQKVLENFGTVIHPKGQVRRTIVFTHSGAKQRMMLNLSNTHLSLVNIDDLKNPKGQSVEEVAAFEGQLFKFGNYMVQHVQMGAYEPYSWGGQGGNVSEFRVKKIGGKLDTTKAEASFLVGQVQRVMKFKNNLLVFRRIPKEAASKTGYIYWTSEIEAVIYDLSNPTKPIKKGSIKLPYSYLPYYYYYCGWRGYWGGYWFSPYSYYYRYSMDAWTKTDSGLTFLTHEYDSKSKSYIKKMVFLDLTNTAKPNLHTEVLTSNKEWYFYGLVPDGSDAKSFYLTYRVAKGPVKIGSYTLYTYKYYAQRWTKGVGGWTFGAPVNVPGRLIKAYKDKGQQLLLTYDFTYKKKASNNSSYWVPSYRLNLLRRVNYGGKPLAELLDFNNFKSLSLKDLVLDGSKLFVNARNYSYYYYYDGYANTSSTTDDYSDRLMLFDLSGHKLNLQYEGATGTYNVRLMGTHKGRLFAYLPGDGVLVVDASTKNPTTGKLEPTGQQFMRTLGYATHLEFAGDTVYVAAGYFGTFQFDLLKAAWPNI